MLGKFNRWFMCRIWNKVNYNVWIAAGNAKHRDWNCDENYILFLKWRESDA